MHLNKLITIVNFAVGILSIIFYFIDYNEIGKEATPFDTFISVFLILSLSHIIVLSSLIKAPISLTFILAFFSIPFLMEMNQSSYILTDKLSKYGVLTLANIGVILIYWFHFKQKDKKDYLDYIKLIWVVSLELILICHHILNITRWPFESQLEIIQLTLTCTLIVFFYYHGIKKKGFF